MIKPAQEYQILRSSREIQPPAKTMMHVPACPIVLHKPVSHQGKKKIKTAIFTSKQRNLKRKAETAGTNEVQERNIYKIQFCFRRNADQNLTSRSSYQIRTSLTLAHKRPNPRMIQLYCRPLLSYSCTFLSLHDSFWKTANLATSIMDLSLNG